MISAPLLALDPTDERPFRTPLLVDSPCFVWADAKRTVSSQGGDSLITTPAADASGVCSAVRATEAALGESFWAIALPFDRHRPSFIQRLPRVLETSAWHPLNGGRHPTTQLLRRGAPASRGAFEKRVLRALSALEEKDLQKVVLAQESYFDLPEKPDLVSLLSRLRFNFPGGTTYALRLSGKDAADEHWFVGCSPELLVEKWENRVRCVPLAGSRPRGETPEQDLGNERELLASEKDLREHRYLVDEIVEKLRSLNLRVVPQKGPETRATPSMWHLATPIEAEVRSSDTTVLELALALHPTAAVCGIPREKAASTIRQLEPFERGFYGGALGTMNRRGDGEFIVAIRGAELCGTSARVLSGAGIVIGSDAQAECRETEDKMKSILEALSSL